MKNILLLTVAFFVCVNCDLNAQNHEGDTTLVQVQTTDGNVFVGRITYEDSQKIKLATDRFGELTLARVDIISIRPIKGSQLMAGTFWPENPQATRYFWSSNGYGLKKGEGYYQNVWVLFNQVNYGVTDNVSIGAGLVPLFLFGGMQTPVWVTTKFSLPIQKDQVNLGAGALVGTITGEDGSSFALLYGVSTFGSRDKNLSVGLGYGVADGEFSNSPTISISGLIRTGPKGYFITDNYLFSVDNETTGFFSLGGRRMFKNAGLDYGLVVPISPDMEDFIAIPWLGITIAFGDPK